MDEIETNDVKPYEFEDWEIGFDYSTMNDAINKLTIGEISDSCKVTEVVRSSIEQCVRENLTLLRNQLQGGATIYPDAIYCGDCDIWGTLAETKIPFEDIVGMFAEFVEDFPEEDALPALLRWEAVVKNAIEKCRASEWKS